MSGSLFRGFLAMVQDYQTGDRFGLLLAIEKALRMQARLTEQERAELFAILSGDLRAALDEHHAGRAASLDDVFGLARPKNWNQAAHRKLADKGLRAALLAAQLVDAGYSTNNTSRRYAFREAGKRLHVSAAWVRDRYYEAFPNRSKRSRKTLEP